MLWVISSETFLNKRLYMLNFYSDIFLSNKICWFFNQVPADMVVNATIAAMAKHGSCTNPGMHIYHVASSNVNPLVFSQLADIMFEHFSAFPYVDSTGKPIQVEPLKLFHDMSEFSNFILTDAMEKSTKIAGSISKERISDRLKALFMKLVERTKYLATIYEPYTFYGGR